MDGWKGGEDMSTRKRIVGLIAAVAFAASVVACGQGEPPRPRQPRLRRDGCPEIGQLEFPQCLWLLIRGRLRASE